MAEFLEVMKQRKRMCTKYEGGGICQSIDYNMCPLKGHDLCCRPLTNIDINKIQEGEVIIMKWAAEHPEPVYPSWIDWLMSEGVIPTNYMVANSTDSGVRAGTFYVTSKAFEPIPVDIAQKLGLQPKGV